MKDVNYIENKHKIINYKSISRRRKSTRHKSRSGKVSRRKVSRRKVSRRKVSRRKSRTGKVSRRKSRTGKVSRRKSRVSKRIIRSVKRRINSKRRVSKDGKLSPVSKKQGSASRYCNQFGLESDECLDRVQYLPNNIKKKILNKTNEKHTNNKKISSNSTSNIKCNTVNNFISEKGNKISVDDYEDFVESQGIAGFLSRKDIDECLKELGASLKSTLSKCDILNIKKDSIITDSEYDKFISDKILSKEDIDKCLRRLEVKKQKNTNIDFSSTLSSEKNKNFMQQISSAFPKSEGWLSF